MKSLTATLIALMIALPVQAQDNVPRIPTVQPPPPNPEIGHFCADDSGCPFPGAIIPEHGNKAPMYPATAKTAGSTGTVKLALAVRGDGSVDPAATVVTSSGGAEFDAAALDAVRTWRFTMLGERSAAASITSNITITFVLAGRCNAGDTRSAWLPDRRAPHLVVMGCPEHR